VNFGVTFPLAKKTVVVKSTDQSAIFSWLTNKSKNGWNEKAPSWNFSKYLIDEQGTLTHYFDPSVSPLSEEVVKAVEK
jgi:glutathione peroxidase